MTHFIFETMVLEQHYNKHLWRRDLVGHRISGDGGKSWVVAGRLTFYKTDSFESRTRAITMDEYSHRMANSLRTLTITDGSQRVRP